MDDFIMIDDDDFRIILIQEVQICSKFGGIVTNKHWKINSRLSAIMLFYFYTFVNKGSLKQASLILSKYMVINKHLPNLLFKALERFLVIIKIAST